MNNSKLPALVYEWANETNTIIQYLGGGLVGTDNPENGKAVYTVSGLVALAVYDLKEIEQAYKRDGEQIPFDLAALVEQAARPIWEGGAVNA